MPNSRAPSLRGHYPASSLPRARPPPLAVGRFPGSTGYTAYPAPPISRRDEEGFSIALTCPGRRAVARTPPEGSRRVSQTATLPAAFPREISARPPEPFLEATLAFTHVTARPLAPILPMVRRWAPELWFPAALSSKLRGGWLLPRWDCLPLNTSAFSETHTSRTTTERAPTCRSTRMRPTAGSLNRRNSAGSSRFAKSVASTIATFGWRPDTAHPFPTLAPEYAARRAPWAPLLRLVGSGSGPNRLAVLPPTRRGVSPSLVLARARASSTQLDEILDRRTGGAGFYFHIDPTTCFMAGGLWMPARPALQRIREAIAAQPTALARLTRAAGFRRRFDGLSEEAKLRRVPQGVPARSPPGGVVEAPVVHGLGFDRAGRGHEPAPGRSPVPGLRGARALVRWLNHALGYQPAKSRW